MKIKILTLLAVICILLSTALIVSCGDVNEEATTVDESEVTVADTTAVEQTTGDGEATGEWATAGGETTIEEETTVLDLPGVNAAAFKVYCPANANAWEKAAAKQLSEKLSCELSDDITVANVLVGKQCLDAKYTAKADYGKIGYNGYSNYVVEKKAVLTAKTEMGIAKAIDEFVNNSVSEFEGHKIVSETYTASEDEVLNTVTPATDKHLDVVLSDNAYDVYKVPEILYSGYRYGPSIMVYEDGSMDAWFASTGCGGYQWDWITYRHSDDGVNWTDEVCVLQPTPNGLDHWSCCDPGVIKFNGYYYIGYTSTVNANQKDNCVFVARSENPDGPYEKWNGHGWGGNDPQPIVFFDESTDLWGAGEPSFVELNGTLYIYYTWMGSDGRETWVSTADATDDNWPATMQYRGIAVPAANSDSIDVKYVEEYGKFIAIATDQRLTANSHILFFESDDGITFTKADIAKEKSAQYCHNSGISGSENGHIVPGRKLLVGYGYGKDWGVWNTRFQEISIELRDKVDLSERNKSNQVVELVRDKRDPESLPISSITMGDGNDVLYVSKVRNSFTLKVLYGTTFQNKWKKVADHPDAKEIKYSGYDDKIVQCTDGEFDVKVVGEGMTMIRIEWKGTETFVHVRVCNSKNKSKVVGIEPLVKSEFVIDTTTGRKYTPQIKTKVLFADTGWAEAFGGDITYTDYDTNIIKINTIGQVFGLNPGTTEVTVTKAEYSYKVKVTVIGKDKEIDFSNLNAEEDGQQVVKQAFRPTNNASVEYNDGRFLFTAISGNDPIVEIDYTRVKMNTADYKSITITYMIPAGQSRTSYKGQMFFICGSATGPAEAASQKYDMKANGSWNEVTLDLTDKAYWDGDLRTIRYDFFDACGDGDYLFIKSIKLNRA